MELSASDDLVCLMVGAAYGFKWGNTLRRSVFRKIFLTVGGVERLGVGTGGGSTSWRGELWESKGETRPRARQPQQESGCRGRGLSSGQASRVRVGGQPRHPLPALEACELAVDICHGKLRGHKGTIYIDFFFNLL